MLIVMKKEASPEQIEAVQRYVEGLGYAPHLLPGAQRVVIGVTGNATSLALDPVVHLDGVAEAIPVSKPYRLAGRDAKAGDTKISVGETTIGGRDLALIAGPCSVESREQLLGIAEILRSAGVRLLRGGAFKPRTSPYAFQGMREEGLSILKEARDRTGMKIVTEVKDLATLASVAETADVLQIGSRNMHNTSLLEAVGDLRIPVLLKRGMSATIEELLMAAEYILARGNPNVILCERGIRTFETATRNTLDLNAIPVVKQISHLPILVDPSHGIGMWAGVPSMALAGIAAGADGLLIEVHDDPARALSDGFQSLRTSRFLELLARIRALAPVVGRSLPPAPHAP